MARRIIALTLALALAGCGDNAPGDRAPGAVLRVDVVGELDRNVFSATNGAPGEAIVDATQRGLVDIDAAGQVVPGLATSWRVSDDGRGYIFRLREARWQDGRELTASDVVAVYRRILAPDSRHRFRSLLANIENAPAVMARRKSPKALGIHDPLPNIVEIRLTTPQPELLQLLAHPSLSIIRRGAFPPAIGAFVAADAAARPVRLARNKDYYDASAVPLAGVDLRPAPDPVEAIARFRRGETDIVTGGTIAGLGEARTILVKGALRVEPSYGVYTYVANVRKGPLADLRLRRALGMSVSRDLIVERLFAIPGLRPARGLTPPGLPRQGSVEPDWSNWLIEARIEEARRLLAEAGHGPGRRLRLDLALPTGHEHAAVAAEVARAWAAIGVDIHITTRSARLHAEAMAKDDYDLALVERLSPVASALVFLEPFTCAAKRGGYCNPEADRLLDAARGMPDLSERTQALRRAEALMIDDAPAITLFSPVRWSLVHPRVSGWTDNIIGAHPLARLDMLPGHKE